MTETNETILTQTHTFEDTLMIDTRSVPISARIPSEDAVFLAALKIDGAITPSDKLRAIIAHARRLHEGQDDYNASLTWLGDLLAPALARIRAVEHGARLRSELVSSSAEWLPQMLALFLAYRDGGASKKGLLELEKALADHAFHFVESLLRLGVTMEAPCYDKGLISDRMEPALNLTRIILATKK